MANHVYIVGIDPGLANCGYAVVELFEKSEKVHAIGNFKTTPSQKKLKVLVGDDNDRRADELFDNLDGLFAQYDRSIKAVCFEAQSIPRSSSNAAKTALGRGIARAVARRTYLPTLNVTPQRMKQLLCGSQKATKEQIQKAVEARYPETKRVRDKLPKEQWEHPYDAAGAVIACMNADVILMARKMCDR